MSTERAHHPYGPSTLSSLRACPSFEGEQAKTPHFRTIIGQKGHTVIESGEDDATLSDEDAALAAHCRAVYEEQKILLGPGATELAEVYLPIDNDDTCAGYIDAAIINAAGDYGVLLDWKLGMWAVPAAKDNPQVAAYALGLFKRYPALNTIRAFVVQPTLDYTTDATFIRSQIPAMHAEVWAIVARAKAARQAGDFKTATAYYPNCNFCRHVGICPVVTRLVGEVGRKFAPLMIPEDIALLILQDPKTSQRGWQLASVVEVWAKAFRQAITNRVLRRESEPPEGYKLVSRSKREIVDAAKYRESALKRLTPEEYDATLKPSLTAVEDLISAKAPRGSKTAAVKEFSEELDTTGATTLGEPAVFLKAVSAKPE